MEYHQITYYLALVLYLRHKINYSYVILYETVQMGTKHSEQAQYQPIVWQMEQNKINDTVMNETLEIFNASLETFKQTHELTKQSLAASQEANKIAESKRSYSVNIAILFVSSIALVVSIVTLLLSILS